MDIVRYETKGVCSSFIEVKIENNIIKDIHFIGGCNGNLQGISALCKEMDINEVIKKLKGIRCANKLTSCPDQLANCLLEYLKEYSKKAKEKTI